MYDEINNDRSLVEFESSMKTLPAARVKEKQRTETIESSRSAHDMPFAYKQYFTSRLCRVSVWQWLLLKCLFWKVSYKVLKAKFRKFTDKVSFKAGQFSQWLSWKHPQAAIFSEMKWMHKWMEKCRNLINYLTFSHSDDIFQISNIK